MKTKIEVKTIIHKHIVRKSECHAIWWILPGRERLLWREISRVQVRRKSALQKYNISPHMKTKKEVKTIIHKHIVRKSECHAIWWILPGRERLLWREISRVQVRWESALQKYNISPHMKTKKEVETTIHKHIKSFHFVCSSKNQSSRSIVVGIYWAFARLV